MEGSQRVNIAYVPYEMRHYKEEEYQKFLEYLEEKEFDDYWVFRSQPADSMLATTLERALQKSGFPIGEAELIEKTMIREFSRLYDGQDCQTVRSDTLYCLSLLRHYGAPSRLLDFTYSKYIALYFGLQCAYDAVPQRNGKPSYDEPRSFAIWCVNTKELNEKVEKEYRWRDGFLKALKFRGSIKTRDDESFRHLYMNKAPYRLVISENPALLHQRLHLQRGVFLCPGNIKESFMDNLLHPYHSPQKIEGIKKIVCNLGTPNLHSEFMRLIRMNITHESLFPGLDGLARSMEYQICFYKDLAKRIKEYEGW